MFIKINNTQLIARFWRLMENYNPIPCTNYIHIIFLKEKQW